MSALNNINAAWQNALAPLRARWQSLDARSRRVASIGSAIVVLMLLWAYVWLPAARGRIELAARLPAMQATLANMQMEAEEVKRISSMPAIAGKQSARSTVDATGLQATFGAAASVKTSGSAFRVSIATMPYAEWLDRLDQVLARYRVRLVSLKIDAVPGEGKVLTSNVAVELTVIDENSPVSSAAAK
jgi:type II secretory pathway component PulM